MNTQHPTLAEILADPEVQAIEAALTTQIDEQAKVRASERQFRDAVLNAAAGGGAVLVIPVSQYLN